jgi:hypothetical protein
VLDVILQHMNERVADLTRGRQLYPVPAIHPDTPTPKKQQLDAMREPHGQTAQTSAGAFAGKAVERSKPDPSAPLRQEQRPIIVVPPGESLDLVEYGLGHVVQRLSLGHCPLDDGAHASHVEQFARVVLRFSNAI